MICSQCNVNKELNKDNFYYRKDSNKWRTICKICISINSKLKYKINSTEIKTKSLIYRTLNKETINSKAIIYNNKKEVKIRSAKWRKENRELLRKKEMNWKIKNPEKHKAIVRKKSKKQSLKPTSKIKAHVSRQIRNALFKNNQSKNGDSVLKFLQFSIKELKDHLEKQFESWMTWDNYGIYKLSTWDDNNILTWKWNIDHIIPQSNFKYSSMKEENFRKCWDLNNLRPYSAKLNALDGANRIRHL